MSSTRFKWIIVCMTLFFVDYAQAQTEWMSGSVDTVYHFLESRFGITYHASPTFQVRNAELLAQRMEDGCLMISRLSQTDDGIELLQGCYGLDGASGQMVRKGGIVFETPAQNSPIFKKNSVPNMIKSHDGSMYTHFIATDSTQVGPWQLPGNQIALLDSQLNGLDTISIEEDQQFWDDRYPVRWAPTVYDGHEWGAGKINGEIYLFAILVYRDSFQVSLEPPSSVHIQRQAIVAYHYDTQLENCLITDILELDRDLDPSTVVPGQDPHHTNELDVTPDDGKLQVTFSNRGFNNIYKVAFNGNTFENVAYIFGNPFPTEETFLPFIGNMTGDFPLASLHGSELILHPEEEDVDFIYSYNNGIIGFPFQALSYTATKIIGDTLVEELSPYEVYAYDTISVYSRCCGGLEEVFKTDPQQPILAMERGWSGWIRPEVEEFISMIEDEEFEPMISLMIPPPFSVDSQWMPLLDVYAPEGFNLQSARSGTMTILYEDLPTSRLNPITYWHQDGLTYLAHEGNYLWELDGVNIVTEFDTISIAGTLDEAVLAERVMAYVRDSLYMWPVIGGFTDVTISSTSESWNADHSFSIQPNPSMDYLIVELKDGSNRAYSIIASDGSLVRKKKLISSKTTIDIKDLSTGTYFLQIEGQTETFIKY